MLHDTKIAKGETKQILRTKGLKSRRSSWRDCQTKMQSRDRKWRKAICGFQNQVHVTKRAFRTAYQLAASVHEFPKGTSLRLLQNTAINLAKRLLTNGEEKSDLKKKVEKFAEENSSEMPDMRHQRKGVRFRHHYFITLYDEFKHCYPETEISYFTFSS